MSGHPANYGRECGEGRVRCELCPRQCLLEEGQRGFCRVRGVADGQLRLYSYGRSSGFCVDPVEKKPLHHFLPGTPVLSFGGAGCNLACRFCQNHLLAQEDRLTRVDPGVIAAAALQHGCSAVAFTYNEPLIATEFVIDVAQACREHGLKTIAVSAGYVQGQAREDFFAHMDAANIDLKAFSDDFYQDMCSAHLQPVLETLEFIQDAGACWLEVTTLLIPGANDSDREVADIATWMAGALGVEVPLHLSAFHPAHHLQNRSATSPHTLIRARQIALRQGLHHVYCGNIHDVDSDSTYCHVCGAECIARDWYELCEYQLDEQGHCLDCGTRMPGVFAEGPGRSSPRSQIIFV